MTSGDLVRILDGLNSADLVRQVKALDDYFALAPGSISEFDKGAVLSAGVRLLETSANPVLIMQRLHGFGRDAEPSLTAMLTQGSFSREAKIFASLVLLSLGSRLGDQILVEEVAQGSRFAMAASRALAEAGIADHAPYVIERLRRSATPVGSRIPTEEDDFALGYLKDLLKLRVPIPDDLRSRFSGPNAPQYFRAAFEQYCSEGSGD